MLSYPTAKHYSKLFYSFLINYRSNHLGNTIFCYCCIIKISVKQIGISFECCIRYQWNFQSVVKIFFYLWFPQLNLGYNFNHRVGGAIYKSCYLCQSFSKNKMYLLNIFNLSPHPTLRNDIFNNSISYSLTMLILTQSKKVNRIPCIWVNHKKFECCKIKSCG